MEVSVPQGGDARIHKIVSRMRAALNSTDKPLPEPFDLGRTMPTREADWAPLDYSNAFDIKADWKLGGSCRTLQFGGWRTGHPLYFGQFITLALYSDPYHKMERTRLWRTGDIWSFLVVDVRSAEQRQGVPLHPPVTIMALHRGGDPHLPPSGKVWMDEHFNVVDFELNLSIVLGAVTDDRVPGLLQKYYRAEARRE